MHPYRPLHVADEAPAAAPCDDDRSLAVVMIALGAIRVVPAIVFGETFGAEATLAAVAVIGGVALLVRGRR